MLRWLPLAFRFEIRGLSRGRVGALALVAYLSIGALALVLGDRHVAEWQQAVETAELVQRESVEQARGYLAAGQGPEDRPWVDLSQPMWQDYYAGTRVLREPGALAGIAAGSVDPAPVAFQVHRRADPLAGAGYRIENPELATGSVDLAFVIAILSPLLIGVLGVNIGGREREDRIDRLIVVQAGELQGWLLSRLVTLTGLAATCNAGLSLVAGLLGGASVPELAALVAFGVGYAALWGGLLAVVSVHSRSVRTTALTYGSVWMGLCILLPTVAAEVSLARVQTDFGESMTLEARALSYEAYELAIEDVTTQVYARYPDLEDLPAASDQELAPQARRHATDAVLVAAMSDRFTVRQREARDAQRVAEGAAWASPAIALTLAFERLAGVGPEAALAFQGYAIDAVEQRIRWILHHVWRKSPVDQTDFDTLVEDAPDPFRWEPRDVGMPGLVLAVWTLASWMLAVVVSRRSERQIGTMG